MVPNDFSFDSFDETNERYFIVKDQFGKECWYDSKTDEVTPLEYSLQDCLNPQNKISFNLKKALRWDSKPSDN